MFFCSLDRCEMLECCGTGAAFFYRAVYECTCNNNNMHETQRLPGAVLSSLTTTLYDQ